MDIDNIDGTEQGLTRADGLWFDDCSLIIQAETTIFRISREFLAIHSPIFRDMLSLPTPRDAERMDGCPLVCLPDSAEDVTVFLKALLYYDFFEPYPAATTYPILSGVLRMSHKYEVDALRNRALTQLSQFHPTTLVGWEEFAGKRGSCTWLTHPPSVLIAIVALARQLSIDWILPSAFYLVCEFTPERLILLESDDVELSSDDKVWCVTACRLLETTSVTRILDFLWSPTHINGCEARRACADARVYARRAAEAWRDRAADEAAIMPLDLWTDATGWNGLKVCDVCLSAMKIAHQEAKQAIWDRLPEMFGLPEWPELEKMKAQAFK
ncbi:hypothetical protein B0H17DRAFT_961498 [Mycena rosella]|uniref:BTB domain-containing protein n=1 Tax=Mycena rosella TaxID=1033263 RepID=A0AAD7FRS2_MYCRO|nr:hypothetical protein B0H17DRAFT_961498 [Mycena rosella]